MKNIFLFSVSCLISVLALSFFYIPIIVTLILYAMIYFFKEKLLIAYAINFSFLIILLFLSTISNDIVDKQFISPHQKLIADPSFNFLNYPKNRKLKDIVVTKGDLSFVDDLPPEYSNNRKVTFITDDLGFRNNEPFKHDDLIVLGDSYVVGNGGIDQNDTISSKLQHYSNKAIYNLGFPGDPFNYYHRLLKYNELVKKSDGIVLFIFEGNDLNCHTSDKTKVKKENIFFKSLNTLFTYRLTIFHDKVLYKLGFGLYHRVYSIVFQNNSKTYRAVVHGQKTAFLKDYVDILYTDEICPKRQQELSAIYDKYSNKIRLVVYVPTKGHIYFENLGNEKPSENKATVMKELATQYNIDFLDLTQIFQEKKKSQMLYFSDDSHWNEKGIDLAARLISSSLGKIK